MQALAHVAVLAVAALADASGALVVQIAVFGRVGLDTRKEAAVLAHAWGQLADGRRHLQETRIAEGPFRNGDRQAEQPTPRIVAMRSDTHTHTHMEAEG